MFSCGLNKVSSQNSNMIKCGMVTVRVSCTCGRYDAVNKLRWLVKLSFNSFERG